MGIKAVKLLFWKEIFKDTVVGSISLKHGTLHIAVVYFVPVPSSVTYQVKRCRKFEMATRYSHSVVAALVSEDRNCWLPAAAYTSCLSNDRADTDTDTDTDTAAVLHIPTSTSLATLIYTS